MRYFVWIWIGALISGCTGSNTTRPMAHPMIVLSVDGLTMPNQDSVYSFGVVPAGSTSGATTFTVTNVGVDLLELSGGVKFTGDNASDFAVATQPGSALAQGESTTFSVTFSPQASGSKQAAALVFSNDPDDFVYAVGLVGTTTLLKFIDGNGTNGLNKDTDEPVVNPMLIPFNSKLYAIWDEENSAVGQIRIAVYNSNNDAPSWSFVDGDGANGINQDTSHSAVRPHAILYSNKLYVAWHEANSSAKTQIRVKVYNGDDASPSWAFAEGGAESGLNRDATQNASNVRLAVFDSKLYAIWDEADGSSVQQIRAAVYNGNDASPSWTIVDGNLATGLNKDTARAASNPTLAVLQNKLYATWQETNGSKTQIRVRLYNGDDDSPAWTFVDGNGTNGINKSTAQDATNPDIVVYNNVLFAAWQESNGSQDQIRTAYYNGNDGEPAWTFVDGNGTNGINRDITKNAQTPRLVTFIGTLLAVWSEDDGTANQMRLYQFNGNITSPSWRALDGGLSTGANFDTTKNALAPHATVFDSKLYFTWKESNGTQNQLRSAVINF